MSERKAYKTTKVPVSRTQEAIRRLLMKYGVMGCQFTDNFESGEIILRFVKKVDEMPRTVQISLFAEGNEKQAYRQLHYWLKSQLEAVDFGLTRFEQAFLAHFEWVLETGEVTTIGDIVIPELSRQTAGRLLGPGITGTRESETQVEGEWEEVE